MEGAQAIACASLRPVRLIASDARGPQPRRVPAKFAAVAKQRRTAHPARPFPAPSCIDAASPAARPDISPRPHWPGAHPVPDKTLIKTVRRASSASASHGVPSLPFAVDVRHTRDSTPPAPSSPPSPPPSPSSCSPPSAASPQPSSSPPPAHSSSHPASASMPRCQVHPTRRPSPRRPPS